MHVRSMQAHSDHAALKGELLHACNLPFSGCAQSCTVFGTGWTQSCTVFGTGWTQSCTVFGTGWTVESSLHAEVGHESCGSCQACWTDGAARKPLCGGAAHSSSAVAGAAKRANMHGSNVHHCWGGGGVEKGLVLPYRVTVLQGTELARMGRLCASVGNNRPRVDLHRHGLPWSEGASFKSAPDHTYVVRHQTDICSFTPPAMPESLVDQLACCPPRPPRPPRPPTIDRPSISAYMIVHKGSSTTAWRGALQVAAGGGCQEGGVHCSEAPPKNVPDVYE
jgi:hypothetical protein